MTLDPHRSQLEQALALQARGELFAAIAIYRQVLAEAPGHGDASLFLASALRASGAHDEALALYADLCRTMPGRSELWFNRANALGDRGDWREAIACYRHALSLAPDDASIHANLAIAQTRSGDREAAMDSYRRAIDLDPKNRLANHNLGNLLIEAGRLQEAAALLRQTIQNHPDLAEAHYNLALALLRLGDFANGFAEYEWRWQTGGQFVKPGYRDMPVWDGRPFAGKTLVVHAEQGLGDMIQFARLLGLARSLGGDVVFHVPQKMAQLFAGLPFDIRIAGAHAAGEGDLQVPLMSLPHRLKLSPGAIPAQKSYLVAEAERSRSWQQRLGLAGEGRTIGLAWQGNPQSPVERGRSLATPELFAPLAGLKATRLIALQRLPAEQLEPAGTPSGWRVAGLTFTLEHPGPDLDDGPDAFIDTAAIMSSLDHVVSVCTSTLHLAGALGMPSFALLKTVPDWRWMLQGETTPWYPTMRLCRQADNEGFGPVIARLAEHLNRQRSTVRQ